MSAIKLSLLTPDAEVTLHARCEACEGSGERLTGGVSTAKWVPCRDCNGEGTITGRVPLGALLDALGVERRQ